MPLHSVNFKIAKNGLQFAGLLIVLIQQPSKWLRFRFYYSSIFLMSYQKVFSLFSLPTLKELKKKNYPKNEIKTLLILF